MEERVAELFEIATASLPSSAVKSVNLRPDTNFEVESEMLDIDFKDELQKQTSNSPMYRTVTAFTD